MTTITNESILKAVGHCGLILLIILLLFILSTLPLGIFSLGDARPMFMLMGVYYISILRPSLFPIWGVFLIGIMLDFAMSYPLGLNSFILVTVQCLTKNQKVFLSAQPFKVIWVGFMMVSFGSGLVEWLVFSIFSTNLFSFKPVLISTLLSSLIFPIIALPLAAVHKALDEAVVDIK